MTFGNQLKTAILLALLTALLLFAGSLFGKGGLFIAIVFVGIMNFVSYFYSDRIVLWMYRAKPVTEKQAPRLYRICRELAGKTGLPMPKVYIIPDKNANAFATGRNPQHSAVAATEGILELLDEDELRGVMAHEFAHIRNRDILISTVAGTIAGIISFIANMAMWSAMFGDRDNRGNALSLILLAIITPIIATIIQLAISRSREYLADASGARTMGDGKPLASALEKLERSNRHHPMRAGNQGTAHLFITNPFTARGMTALLLTHPPTEERVRRLKGMRF
ncbi:TPA: zinc metalloprotease HtpX [Candidatus Woesearchaeota archaeon]|nr:zinc metalloprotease HtpX [Candidatus Woesearchaeota archaeon]HII65785.1 zinc metalloprotease HtpX [Candidatus Woesearchaeota archaeon]